MSNSTLPKGFTPTRASGARHPSKYEEMFGDDLSPAELAKAYLDYEGAINKSFTDTFSGRVEMGPGPEGEGVVLRKAATAQEQLGQALELLGKAVSPDVVSSIQAQLAAPDVVKDLTLGSPVASFPSTNPAGWLVPFDLEAPAKLLAPRPTPIRNAIRRMQGFGTAHRFKRITGFSNSPVGSIGKLHPGIADTTQTRFDNSGSSNALYYNRGSKISWAGDDKVLPYHQFGLSDEVPWSAQFSGQGFQDIRALSASGVLWASLVAEELMFLGGRGTNTTLPYAGAVADPVANGGTLSATSRNAGTGETGNSANIANLYITVTAETVWGESVFTGASVLTYTGLSAATGKVLDVGLTNTVAQSYGATGFRVYAGTTNARASLFYSGRTGFSSTATGQGSAMYTINFTGGGTGGAPSTGANPPAADTSAYTNGYDGMLAYADSANSGYTGRVNGKLSTTSPGSELETMFASMWQNQLADPDEVWFSGIDRAQQSRAFRSNAGANAYRVTFTSDGAGNVTGGAVVSSLYNPVTGKQVAFRVHPMMPQGNAMAISHQVPYPDSQVDAVWSAVDVQPYMGIAWPVNQFSYDFSSYWYGSLMCQWPAGQGYLGGIQQG